MSIASEQEPLRDAAFWRAFTEKLHAPLSRRDFAHLLAASIALAGESCSVNQPPKESLAQGHRSERTRPGETTRYATTLWHGPYGVGVIAATREGRAIKVEGNPRHPASGGGTGAWEQASVLQLYDPDRLRVVHCQGRQANWTAALTEMRARMNGDGDGVAVLWEPRCSPSVLSQFDKLQAAYPKLRVFSHSAWFNANAEQGARLLFGKVMEPLWHIRNDANVVSFDADFLGVFPDRLRLSRDWATAPSAQLYCSEARLTLTGTNATLRVAATPAEVERLALAAFAPALDLRQQVRRSEREGPFLQQLRKRDSVYFAGPSQDPVIHAAAGLASGSRCSWRAPLLPEHHRGGSLEAFCSALASGDLHTVIIAGGDPVYQAAAQLQPHLHRLSSSFYFGMHVNATAQACAWALPEAHPLETWGDAQAYDGTTSLLQPVMQPLGAGLSLGDMLAAFVDERAPQGRGAIASFWRGRGVSDKEFNDALGRGVLLNHVAPENAPAGASEELRASAQALLGRPPVTGARTLSVQFPLDYSVGDGALANNAWLQELPDPVTGLCWGNAAQVASEDAQALGVRTGAHVDIAIGDATVRCPVLVMPSQAAGVIALPMGYGKNAHERVARDIGVNANLLRESPTQHIRHGATLTVTGTHEELAFTQDPSTWSADLDLRPANIAYASWRSTDKDPRCSAETPQWGMAIDLNRCTGCHACVVACQAENNIPVVGKFNVVKGRSMYWLRLDRYRNASTHTALPMLCQHCEQAPCEYVCPVGATQHSPDGLNEMVYNRCVGTRFCSNNCPYKVRRFNWFAYAEKASAMERLAFNPEVSVRSRGVMEKCTFCVQRIRLAGIQATLERRALRDGEVVTACQQACPTQAIQFGNLADDNSAVAQAFSDNRSHSALAHLGTRPRIRYLSRTRGGLA